MVNYLNRLGRPIVEVYDIKGEDPCWSKGELFTLEEIIPAPLCPFAYHNLSPYIVTLINDGWFRWVKREKHSKRHPSVSVDQFKDSSVNSAFPNEVLVQCPNPQSSVVMGVGLEENGGKTVTVRVLGLEAPCPMGHAKGDEFKLREEDMKISPLIYNALFPYMLLSGSGKSGFVKCPDPNEDITFRIRQNLVGPHSCHPGEDFDVCFPYKKQGIKATRIKSPCRYHSGPTGIERVAPEGMCLAAFHVAYPYSLALLYDADFPDVDEKGSIYVRCPNPQGGIVLEVKRVLTTSSGMRFLKSLGAKVFETFFHPVDVINYKIVYNIAAVQGTCPAGYRAGERFEFNVWKRNELCPASFHSLYPYLLLKNQGVSFNWREGETQNEVACPDCRGAVYQF